MGYERLTCIHTGLLPQLHLTRENVPLAVERTEINGDEIFQEKYCIFHAQGPPEIECSLFVWCKPRRQSAGFGGVSQRDLVG